MSPSLAKGWTAIGFPWGSWAAKEETKPGQQMWLMWSQRSKWSQFSLNRGTSGQLRKREGNLHVLSNCCVPDWAVNTWPYWIIRKACGGRGYFPHFTDKETDSVRWIAQPQVIPPVEHKTAWLNACVCSVIPSYKWWRKNKGKGRAIKQAN